MVANTVERRREYKYSSTNSSIIDKVVVMTEQCSMKIQYHAIS
jgi:hypothetical protein